jgi:hypothetical protein
MDGFRINHPGEESTDKLCCDQRPEEDLFARDGRLVYVRSIAVGEP